MMTLYDYITMSQEFEKHMMKKTKYPFSNNGECKYEDVRYNRSKLELIWETRYRLLYILDSKLGVR